jgi:hypothetical protein
MSFGEGCFVLGFLGLADRLSAFRSEYGDASRRSGLKIGLEALCQAAPRK